MSTSELTRYEQTVVNSWSEMHKKSTLMLLILLALVRDPGWSGDIKAFIKELSGDRLGVDDQSLHRALRRLEGLNAITHTEQPVAGSGIPRKVYELTQSGERILNAYLETTLSYTRNPVFRELVDAHGIG